MNPKRKVFKMPKTKRKRAVQSSGQTSALSLVQSTLMMRKLNTLWLSAFQRLKRLTSAKALKACSDLIQVGVKSEIIYEQLFQTKQMSYLKLLTLALGILRQECEGEVVWTKLTKDMIKSSGVPFVDTDVIIVVNHDQVIKAKVSGKGARLRGNAFLQVAVAGNDVHVVVDNGESIPVEMISKVFLCYCHPDGV